MNLVAHLKTLAVFAAIAAVLAFFTVWPFALAAVVFAGLFAVIYRAIYEQFVPDEPYDDPYDPLY